MFKILGIGAVVLGIWCATEFYTKGAGNAFGGILSRVGAAEEPVGDPAKDTPGRRAGAAAQRAFDEAAARQERMLGE